jgi:hypothetical protein
MVASDEPMTLLELESECPVSETVVTLISHPQQSVGFERNVVVMVSIRNLKNNAD